MLKPEHHKTFNKVVGGLKAVKAVTNALGTSPTETPDVKYKKENTQTIKGKGEKEGKKSTGNKPKAGTPGTTVDVQLDENGYQTDY